MSIDWNLLFLIGGPAFAAVISPIITRAVQNRPKIVAYIGHVGAFKLRNDDGNDKDVFTHAIAFRNAGRRSATNVRLTHNLLPPDFTVFPQIKYHVEDLPEGGKDIVFPIVTPGDQVQVSYLYFPPVTWDQINYSIKSDTGPGKVVQVLIQQQFPKWVTSLIQALLIWGVISLLYVLVVLIFVTDGQNPG